MPGEPGRPSEICQTQRASLDYIVRFAELATEHVCDAVQDLPSSAGIYDYIRATLTSMTLAEGHAVLKSHGLSVVTRKRKDRFWFTMTGDPFSVHVVARPVTAFPAPDDVFRQEEMHWGIRPLETRTLYLMLDVNQVAGASLDTVTLALVANPMKQWLSDGPDIIDEVTLFRSGELALRPPALPDRDEDVFRGLMSRRDEDTAVVEELESYGEEEDEASDEEQDGEERSTN